MDSVSSVLLGDCREGELWGDCREEGDDFGSSVLMSFLSRAILDCIRFSAADMVVGGVWCGSGGSGGGGEGGGGG